MTYWLARKVLYEQQKGKVDMLHIKKKREDTITIYQDIRRDD